MADEDENPRAVIGGNNPPIEETLADTNKDLLAEIEPLALKANTLAPKVKDGIKNDDQLGEIAELVTDTKALFNRIEKQREVEKKPYWDAGKAVDGFFAAHKARLSRIEDIFTELSTAYQRKKAADAKAAADAEAVRLRAEEDKLRAAADTAKRPETAERKHEKADELAAKADEAEARAATSSQDLTKIKTATGVTAGAKTVWTFKITDFDKIPLDKLRPFIDRAAIEKALATYVKINKGAAAMDGVHFSTDVRASFRR